MFDVGGQKNERRKWIDQFDGVTTVLYVTATSDYNQFLYEDGRINRQDESLQVFKSLLGFSCFSNTPFLLFLNKDDLFREKLTLYPFRVTEDDAEENEELDPRNEDFEGPHLDLAKTYATDGSDPEFEACYQAAINYLIDLYLAQMPPSRLEAKIYPHTTTSTNQENVATIMEECQAIILKSAFPHI